MTLQQLKDLRAKIKTLPWELYRSELAQDGDTLAHGVSIKNECGHDIFLLGGGVDGHCAEKETAELVAFAPHLLDSYIALLERIEGIEEMKLRFWEGADPSRYLSIMAHNDAISAVKDYLKWV